MSKAELITLRANILGGMDSYVREVVDKEDVLDYWLMEGVPDEASEEMLMEIAEDRDEFIRISKVFGNIW